MNQHCGLWSISRYNRLPSRSRWKTPWWISEFLLVPDIFYSIMLSFCWSPHFENITLPTRQRCQHLPAHMPSSLIYNSIIGLPFQKLQYRYRLVKYIYYIYVDNCATAMSRLVRCQHFSVIQMSFACSCRKITQWYKRKSFAFSKVVSVLVDDLTMRTERRDSRRFIGIHNILRQKISYERKCYDYTGLRSTMTTRPE